MSNKHVPLKARKVSFAWEDTPLHWVPGDPFTTHTINVLHLLLPAGERWFVHVYKQGPAVHPGRAAARGRHRVHRAGGDALPGPRRGAAAPAGPGSRSDAVHRAGRLALREAARRPHPAAGPPAPLVADGAGGADRGHRALHGLPRRLGAERRGARPAGRRSDHAGPAALARRRGGRAPVRRLRPVRARGRGLRAAGADLGDRVRRAGVPLAARDPVLHGERPDARRRQGHLPGLPPARPAGPAAVHRRDHPFHTRLSEPRLPPVQGVLHRAGRRLPRHLPAAVAASAAEKSQEGAA